MTLTVLLMLALAGLAIGFASGLVGIGGGVLIVPLLYLFYAHPELSGVHMSAALQTPAAAATSLFVVVPTALLGARSYSKAGLVIWRAAVPIAFASAIAAIAGARLALVLPSEVVRIAFGVFLLATGVQLHWRPHASEERPIRMNTAAVLVTGVTVGLLSGLMGIGGGAIAAPLLIYLIGLNLKQAAATSLAIVGLAAIAATVTYAVSGSNAAGMPAGSVGYVHLYAALPVMAGSLVSVRWGAQANQRMKATTLKRVFTAFFIVLGLYLMGQNAAALF